MTRAGKKCRGDAAVAGDEDASDEAILDDQT
jgi:hypothetical protein